jgi:hypothetical protein
LSLLIVDFRQQIDSSLQRLVFWVFYNLFYREI